MSIDIADRVKSAFRFGIWSELSNLFRGLAEMMLLLIWYVSLTQGDTLWLEGFIVLSFIYAGSNVMARLLHYFKLKMLLQRLLLFLWILTVLATSSKLLLFNHIDLNAKEFFGQIFRTELTKPTVFGFWVLLFTLICLLRGVQIARYPVTARELTAGFRLSLILFLVYALIYAKGSFDIFLPTLFCFLFCYLIALALARISDLSDSLGSRLPGFNLQWASGIGLAALCMVIISLLLSKIINLDVAEFLGSGLSLLIQLVVGAIVLITSPILLAVVAVIQFLFKLLAPNLNNMLNQTELDAGNKLLEDLQNQITKTTNFDPRLLIMIGVLLLIVILAILQLRWKPWQRITRGEDGLSETAGNFRLSNPLKNLFPSITQRRRRKSATSLIAAARIRHIYAQLMNLCEKLGKPRPRSLTPNEFLPQMYNLFPLNQKELGTITEAYINVRYGELPETNEDIREVLDAWQRISAFGKMTLDERSKARH